MKSTRGKIQSIATHEKALKDFYYDGKDLYWRSFLGNGPPRICGTVKIRTGNKAYRVMTWLGADCIVHRVIWFYIYKEWPAGEIDHSHAFNAFTWWICGKADEVRQYPNYTEYREYERSLKPKYTPRDNVHKVVAYTKSWAFTIRGPWEDTWQEYKGGEEITLTHGRKIV